MNRAGAPAISIRGRMDGLDGMRALLNGTVVLTHLDLVNRATGSAAMQGFFLLSGFLILRVLLDLKLNAAPGRYFGEFLSFRVLRILPAYYAFLLLLFAGAALWSPELLAQLRPSAGGLFLFYSNYSWIWQDIAKTPWISHLWSLSVEEQFYLLWPLLVWLTPLRHLPRLLLAMALLGPVFRYLTYLALAPVAQARGYPAAAALYIAMPTYLDSFALGGLLCFDEARRRLAAIPNRVFALATLGALALGLGWNAWARGLHALDWAALGYPITMPARFQFLWGYSVIGLLLTILLAKVVETKFWHRFLCLPVIERVGAVTYSLYLIHHGLILLTIGAAAWLLAHTGLPGSLRLLHLPLYFAALYSIAFLSYHWVEQPAMRLRKRLFPRAAGRDK